MDGREYVPILPLPVDPINAIVSPLFTLKLIFLSKYSSASGYLNDTFLNSTVPTSLVSLTSSFPSLIDTSLSNTSLIRRAETCARGSIINIIANIKKADITCIA